MVCDYALLLGYAISLIRILALAFGGYFLIGVVVAKVRQTFIQGRHDELSLELIVHVISWVLFFGISVAILHELGINITAFLGMAGIIGVAIGYAAQSSMSNIISGLCLMLERPFKIGDELIVNGVKGYVADVTLFALVLRNASNVMVRIPHDQYRKDAVSNLTALPLRRYDFCIELQHGNSLAAVHAIIESVIEANVYRAPHHKTHLEVIKIYAYTTTFAVGIWVRHENFLSLKQSIVTELQESLQAHGVILAAFYPGHEKGIA